MKKPPWRLWIGVMIFFTTFTNYMFRGNMGVNMLSMLNKKGKNITVPCATESSSSTTAKPKSTPSLEKPFKWDENQEGLIMAAYLWGYQITVVPGGFLSEYIGPWHVILWTSVGILVANSLCPVISIYGGAYALMVFRILIGMFAGPVYPALNVLIAKWVPPNEKGKFFAAMMGNALGTIATFNIVGQITAIYGWDWGFYCLSFIMLVFCIIFAFVVSDSPDNHKFISEEEKNYIFEQQGGHLSKKKKKFPPYKAIFKSVPFWMCVCGQVGNLYGLNLCLTYAPKFLFEIVGFNLKGSAGLAALPYLVRLLFSAIFGGLGDWLIKSQRMTKTKVRKMFVIFSHFLPAACMALIYLSGCDRAGAVSLLILAQGFNGALVITHMCNPQDLSPNFAGSVYSLMNFFGGVPSLTVPAITGAVTQKYIGTWTAPLIIFTLGAGVLALGGLMFMLLGSGEVQPWNEIKDEPESAQKSENA